MTPARFDGLKIPDISGMAMTVNGPIPPEQIGTAIMHEHLFIEFWRDKTPTWLTPATEASHWNEKLTLENLHLARNRTPIKDNYLLNNLEMATKEALEFKTLGGSTIVDVTNLGLGRDPIALRKVSNVTGLNIIMGSGWYKKSYHPDDMDKRSIEELEDHIKSDIVLGVGQSGIRSGIIGEVGIDGGPITLNEEKNIRAAARASRATGAAITFHSGGKGREKLTVAEMVRQEGADLTRTIFGHCNSYADDVPFLIELLKFGVYVQFDALGRVGAPVSRKSDILGFNPTGPEVALDVLVVEAILLLIDAGYEDMILLSQDVCSKTHLKSYGGTGYSFVQEKFIPELKAQGVGQVQIDKMMVDNPKRVLTFTKPAEST